MKKKIFCLMLALVLLISLFAGCADPTGDDTSTPTPTPTANSSAGGKQEGQSAATSPTEQEQSDGDFLADGNFETDERGIPTAPYDYELPLTVNEDVVTLWTSSWSPAYIPEGGYGSMEYPRYLAEITGVNIEYTIIATANLQQNFSVLLAADDLCDIHSNGLSYYSGTTREAIDDGWFVNLYDYKEYIPNYLYQAGNRTERVYSTIFYTDTIVPAFYGLYDDPLPPQGMMCRKDWADELGINVTTITTYDKLYELLTGYKSLGVESPMTLYSCVARSVGYCFAGFNTTAYVNLFGLPTARVNNGQVEFTLTTEDDRQLMDMISTWYSEDLIDKDWASNSNNTALQTDVTTNKVGYMTFTPGEIGAIEKSTDDPDCEWYALPRTKRTEDQKLSFGQSVSHFTFGHWIINAKSENIPLLVSYADWLYSEEGSFVTSYGVPGYTYEQDADGNIKLLDIITNHPEGLSATWAQMLYSLNPLSDAGMEIQVRKYAIEGGERFLAMHQVWIVDDYKGEHDFPSVTYTDEQTEQLGQYTNDVMTYLNENYMAFIDGSKPMSEWDDYTRTLDELGLGKCREIYQEAYEEYLLRFSN